MLNCDKCGTDGFKANVNERLLFNSVTAALCSRCTHEAEELLRQAGRVEPWVRERWTATLMRERLPGASAEEADRLTASIGAACQRIHEMEEQGRALIVTWLGWDRSAREAGA